MLRTFFFSTLARPPIWDAKCLCIVAQHPPWPLLTRGKQHELPPTLSCCNNQKGLQTPDGGAKAAGQISCFLFK